MTNNKYKILIIAWKDIPSVRLCCKSQCEYLKSIGLIDFRFKESLKVSTADLNWADVIIFVRACTAFEFEMAERCSCAGKQILYVIDDDLLNIPDTFSSAAVHYKGNEQIILSFFELCDVLLTPSRHLAAKYGHWAKKTLLFEEPSFPIEQDGFSSSNYIKIGFAGSSDRAKDIDSILDSVIPVLLEKYGSQISVEFFGAKPDIVDKYNLRHIPYQNSYDQYCEIMKSLNWDIGLAPMPDSEFCACKHYNKFIEYSAYGIAGIYSNVEPYIYAVENGKNGILSDNTSEAWLESLVSLIDNPSKLESIKRVAYEDACTKYSVEKVSIEFYNSVIFEKEYYYAKRIKPIVIPKLICISERLLIKIKKFWR